MGRVVDEVSNEPLTGGTVTVAGYASRRDYAIDYEGRFEVPQLLPGKYTVSVHVSGYGDASRDMTVGTEDLKLNLTATRD
jgi:YbbR domain-containing protein